MSGAQFTTLTGVAATLRVGSRRHLTGLVWTAVAVTIFSGWFAVTRYSVTRELGIRDITALRFGKGALLLAPVLLRRRTSLSRGAWAEGLMFAALWGVPFVLLVALGLSLTSAAQATSIAPILMPLFADLFAWAFLLERQGRQLWLGYTAVFVDLPLLVSASTAVHGPPNLAGQGALVAAAAMRSIYTLLFRNSSLAPIESAALIRFWSRVLSLSIYASPALAASAMLRPPRSSSRQFTKAS